MKKKIAIAFIILTLIMSFSLKISAMQVNPMVINLYLEPGDSEEFQIKLSAGVARDTFELYLMNTVQNIDGTLTYREFDDESSEILNWITLDSEQITLPANEERIITGRVNVPFDGSGSHSAVIMVQQTDAVDRPGSFMSMRMRYAIRVNIHVDRLGQRPNVEILDFSLESDENNQPIILAHFKNTTDLSFPAVADITIRGEDRRLLERVPVFSEVTSIARRDNFRVYPNSELIYKGEVTEPLFPGTYELQLFFRYADGRQIIQRQTIEIGDEFLREEAIRYLTVEPEEIQLSLRPGTSSIQVLQLNNKTSDPIVVKTRPVDIRSDYQHSIFSNLELETRGESEISIQSRGVGRQLLNFKTSRDLKPAGYYGFYEIEVYNQQGDNLETHLLDLSAIVGTELEPESEIMDLSHSKGENEHIFSLTFKNNGLIHISPEAKIQLIDEEEEVYANMILSTEEERVLPEAIGQMMTERNRIMPGTYKALVTLTARGVELDSQEFLIDIEEIEDNVNVN